MEDTQKSFTLNGFVIPYWKETESDELVVQFKNTRDWVPIARMIVNREYIYRPSLTAYQLMALMTGTNDGNVGFWDHAENKPGSKSFLRRLIDTGGIRFNGRMLKSTDKVDFPVFSIVVYPKSDTMYNPYW